MSRAACANRLAEHRRNPFFVIGVPPDATRPEIEREGARILAMLAAGIPGADRYAGPLGEGTRDEETVRAALAELRDPERRLAHEWWARGLGPATR